MMGFWIWCFYVCSTGFLLHVLWFGDVGLFVWLRFDLNYDACKSCGLGSEKGLNFEL